MQKTIECLEWVSSPRCTESTILCEEYETRTYCAAYQTICEEYEQEEYCAEEETYCAEPRNETYCEDYGSRTVCERYETRRVCTRQRTETYCARSVDTEDCIRTREETYCAQQVTERVCVERSSPTGRSTTTRNICESTVNWTVTGTRGVPPRYPNPTASTTLQVGTALSWYPGRPGGNPAPSFALTNNPSWISVSPSGRLQGTAPAEPNSWTFQLAASNPSGSSTITVTVHTQVAAAPAPPEPPEPEPEPEPEPPTTPSPQPPITTTRASLILAAGIPYTFTFLDLFGTQHATVGVPPNPGWEGFPQWMMATRGVGTDFIGFTATPPASLIGQSGTFTIRERGRVNRDFPVSYQVQAAVPPLFVPAAGTAQTVQELEEIDPVVVPDPLGLPRPTLAMTGAPDGITYNPASRTISGAPALGQAGDYTITVTATSAAGSGTWTLKLTVTPATVPVFDPDSGPPQYWIRGRAITALTVPAVAAADPPATYSAAGLPSGITFNPTTRVISGTGDTTSSGTIVITATNTAGTGTYSIPWRVDVATAPKFPADSGFDFAFRLGRIERMELPIAQAYPPPVYTATGGPADSAYDPAARVVEGASHDLTATGTVVQTATNSEGTDTYNQPWVTVEAPVGARVPSFDFPEGTFPATVTPAGLAWKADTNTLLVLDVNGDQVLAYRIDDTGRPAGDVSQGISTTAMRAAFKNVFPDLQAHAIVPTGITYDGRYVYIVDSISNHIFAFEGGQHRGEADVPGNVVGAGIDSRIGGEPSGITWDGLSLMVSVPGNAIFAVTNRQRAPLRDVTQAYLVDAAFGAYVTGVAWDGKYLLVVDSRTDGIYGFLNGRYDGLHDIVPETLRAANPDIVPTGIAITGGGVVYVADADAGRIWAFRFDEEPVERPDPVLTSTNPPLPAPLAPVPDPTVNITPDVMDAAGLERPEGLAYHDGYLYIIDQTSSGAVNAFKDGAVFTGRRIERAAFEGVSRIRPRAATVLPDGTLLVLDNRNHLVVAFRWNESDSAWERDSDQDIDLSTDARNANGLTTDGTFVYVAKAQQPAKIVAFLNGQRVPSADIDIGVRGRGLAWDGHSLLVITGGRPWDGALQRETGPNTSMVRAYTNGIRTPQFDITTESLLAGGILNPRGLTWDGENVLVADTAIDRGGTNRVVAFSRRGALTPTTGQIVYRATGLPEGMRLNPIRHAIIGIPRFNPDLDPDDHGRNTGTAEIVARNAAGADRITMGWIVLENLEGDFFYTITGLPEGMELDPIEVTLSGTPRSAAIGEGSAVLTATNRGGESDALTIPWIVTDGTPPPLLLDHPHPERIEVHWPRTGTDIVETLEGCITGSTKTLVLHEGYHDRGPTIRPSMCSIDFQEEDDIRLRTHPALSERLLELPSGTSFRVTVYDQFDAIYWRGWVTDTFAVDRQIVNTFTLNVVADNARTNYVSPREDLIFENQHIWGTAETWRDSILHQVLTVEFGVPLVPSTMVQPTPAAPLVYAVVPVSPPEGGTRAWDTVKDMLLASGLVMYPTATGSRFHIERLADRRLVADYRECISEKWSTERQQNSVSTLRADFTRTASYMALSGQAIGPIWAGDEDILIQPGGSWPDGATHDNVVPINYTTRYEPDPQGGRPKFLEGATLLAARGRLRLSQDLSGLTIRRRNLHATWADLWITNDGREALPLGAIRTVTGANGLPFTTVVPLSIHANDVIFRDAAATRHRLRNGDPEGKGVLHLPASYIESEAEALSALDELKDWAEKRRYKHVIKWKNPDFDTPPLTHDMILPDGKIVRPIKVTETWRGTQRSIMVEAESASA